MLYVGRHRHTRRQLALSVLAAVAAGTVIAGLAFAAAWMQMASQRQQFAPLPPAACHGPDHPRGEIVTCTDGVWHVDRPVPTYPS